MLEAKTARKAAKPAILRPRQELAALRREVADLRKKLIHSQRLASIGTLATMVAHEYNNILTPVISYAQLAEKRPEFTKKALSKAISGGYRATRISKSLLGLAGQGRQEHQTFSLAELVEDTVSAMARNPEKDCIEFKCLVKKDLKVTGPKIELQQVLLNLFLNARHAVLQKRAGRQIEVNAKISANEIHLTVADNGVGIAKANLPRVFEPFFTTKDAKSSCHEGNGLGLAICREIMHSINGDITVHSKPGRGTTFTLTFRQVV